MVLLQFAFYFNTPILHTVVEMRTNNVARKRKKRRKKKEEKETSSWDASKDHSRNSSGMKRLKLNWQLEKGFSSCQFSFCVTISLSRLICSCSNCMKSSHPFFFTRVNLIRAEDMQMNILCFFLFFFLFFDFYNSNRYLKSSFRWSLLFDREVQRRWASITLLPSRY